MFYQELIAAKLVKFNIVRFCLRLLNDVFTRFPSSLPVISYYLFFILGDASIRTIFYVSSNHGLPNKTIASSSASGC